MKLILEMEIGITGGVEDGVDNSGVSKEKLYSTPEDVKKVYDALNPISPMFTIAAAFGNVAAYRDCPPAYLDCASTDSVKGQHEFLRGVKFGGRGWYVRR